MPPAKNQPVSANYWGKYNHHYALMTLYPFF